MDNDPSDIASDYLCGHRTYDAHKGTDFAIQSQKAMWQGVPVVAAADGVVMRMRNAMPDTGVNAATRTSVAGKECGNGLVLEHGDGWETQYCHLRQNSIVVRIGQRVRAGEKLGFVGLSGLTEFPHVHLTVQKSGRLVDPFIGLVRNQACGPGDQPLWHSDVMTALKYEPFAIYYAGFADRPVNPGAVRAGDLEGDTLQSSAPLLALWTDIFGVARNDILSMRITGPDGSVLAERRHILSQDQARYFGFIGKKNPANDWPVGSYLGEITLLRPQTTDGRPFEKRIVRKMYIQ